MDIADEINYLLEQDNLTNVEKNRLEVLEDFYNNYDNWKTNTYVFINQDGEIEEDMELFKFSQYIFRNPEFMAKLHELLKKQF